MSNVKNSAEIQELKVLREHLKNWESAKSTVAYYEQEISKAKSRSSKDVKVTNAPTDQREREYNKYKGEQSARTGTICGIIIAISIIVLIAMGICWICMSGIFVKDTYLQTPEIIREYAGEYYMISGHKMNSRLNITSCNKKGVIEGTYEFYGNDQYTGKYVSGKYSVKGKITGKSKEGYVNATIKFDSWIEQPAGYRAFEEMQIKIYDDYQVVRCFSNNMCLYATDYMGKVSVSDLNTPEIIQTYSGEFTPNGKKGNASITINNCDDAGQIDGVFEYTFEEGSGKWNVTGQILKKYGDGSVIISLNPTEQVYNSYMFYYPSAMEIEIYNDYKSLDCKNEMHWFYEDTYYAKNPEPYRTPTQIFVRKAAPIVFPAYIAAVVVILVIISLKNSSLTPQQKQRLAELDKRDEENRIKNENAYHDAVAKAEKGKKEDLVHLNQELERAKERVTECAHKCIMMTILSQEDKTLENVEFLIQKMESGRADSLKEALNLMDADKHRRQQSWLMAEMAHQDAMQRARADAEARRDQMYHNMNVEYQQRRQADELEKIRKALEE